MIYSSIRLYENPEFNIAKCYADLMKTMFFTAFYAPIIPIGLVISGICFIALYWIHKVINLYLIYLHLFFKKIIIIKRSSIKINVGSELSIEMIEYLEFVVIIYSVNFFFIKDLKFFNRQLMLYTIKYFLKIYLFFQ